MGMILIYFATRLRIATAITVAPQVRTNAARYEPALIECVNAVREPIAVGAVRLPSWPMLDISAIDPADAVPDRNVAGIVQKIAVHVR